MTAMSQKDFAEHVLKMAKSDEMFTPSAYYDTDGDCIEFFFQPDPFYAKRIDNLVTVYYSQDTNDIIGSQIKSVSKFCKEKLDSNREFQIVIQGGKIKLQHIFRMGLTYPTCLCIIEYVDNGKMTLTLKGNLRMFKTNADQLRGLGLMRMSEMEPLDVAVITDPEFPEYDGKVVMRTASTDHFEVMEITKPGPDECWISPSSGLTVTLVPKGTEITLTVT